MKKNLWFVAALIMGLSAVCSCKDNDEEEKTNKNDEAQTTIPTFGGKVLKGLTPEGEDDDLFSFSAQTDNGKLKSVDLGSIPYQVTHAPFTIKCDMALDGTTFQMLMNATFNDDGLLSTFDSRSEITEPDYSYVVVTQAEAKYNANKQIDTYKLKATYILNGVTDDEYEGTAKFTYQGDVLKSYVANTKGKEMNEDTGKMEDYTMSNTFECIYNKELANKYGQYTNYDASLFSDNDLAAVLAMMGYMGNFSSVFPSEVNQRYVQQGGVDEGEESDTITYDIELNADGTIHKAFGFTYTYDQTRAQIAPSRLDLKRSAHRSIFRK